MVYLGVAILGLLLGTSLLKKGRSALGVWAPALFGGGVVIVFLYLLYVSRLQFLVWRETGPPSSYLLPPYQSIGYFLFYAGTRFWASYIASLIAALVALWFCRRYNRKFGERFFWPEEPYFIALAIFLNGHPGWIIYAILTLAVLLLIGFVFARLERFSFYHFWLPLGILSIILNMYLSQFSWWEALII